jgi:tetratricopeptide (TPR) repeat protein
MNPDYIDAYNDRGAAYSAGGAYDKAISDFTKVLALKSADATAYGARGRLYALKGLYDQAISDFSNAIKLYPGGRDLYNNRGVVYTLKGQYVQAMYDYKNAIKADPEYAAAYYNLGLLAVLNFQYDQAISYFTKVIEIDPNREFRVFSDETREFANKVSMSIFTGTVGKYTPEEIGVLCGMIMCNGNIKNIFETDLLGFLNLLMRYKNLQPTNLDADQFITMLISRYKFFAIFNRKLSDMPLLINDEYVIISTIACWRLKIGR